MGGRYNAARKFGAIYCSFDKETADAEALGGFKAKKLKVSEAALPRLVYKLGIRKMYGVLDLTDKKVLAEIGYRMTDLVQKDLTLTQELGRMARAAGYVAIKAPSKFKRRGHPRGANFVIFELVDVLGTPRIVKA
jgi:hypothetical protein